MATVTMVATVTMDGNGDNDGNGAMDGNGDNENNYNETLAASRLAGAQTHGYKLLNSNDNKAIHNKTITMEQYDSWKVQRVREGQRKLEKVRGGGKVCTVMHADLT